MSLNKRPCQAKPILADINANEPVFYPFTVGVSKCGGSCKTVNDPYTRICVPNKSRQMYVKLFNLMSRVNEIA